MAIPLGLVLAGASLAGGFLNRRKSFLDSPEIRSYLDKYEKLSTDEGATAQAEKYFGPARSRLQRQITGMGSPGASGAVTSGLAELAGQEATAKTDLMHRAAENLLQTKIGLAQNQQPQDAGPDFAGLGQALAYYQYLKRLGTKQAMKVGGENSEFIPGVPGSIPLSKGKGVPLGDEFDPFR